MPWPKLSVVLIHVSPASADLASILEVGKLPAKLRSIQESVVGPSLGEKNIKKNRVDEWKEYYCEKLGSDELIMVCSPHLLEGLDDKSPAALLDKYPAIFVTNLRRKYDWLVWCEANGFIVPKKQKNLTFTASIL